MNKELLLLYAFNDIIMEVNVLQKEFFKWKILKENDDLYNCKVVCHQSFCLKSFYSHVGSELWDMQFVVNTS